MTAFLSNGSRILQLNSAFGNTLQVFVVEVRCLHEYDTNTGTRHALLRSRRVEIPAYVQRTRGTVQKIPTNLTCPLSLPLNHPLITTYTSPSLGFVRQRASLEFQRLHTYIKATLAEIPFGRENYVGNILVWWKRGAKEERCAEESDSRSEAAVGYVTEAGTAFGESDG